MADHLIAPVIPSSTGTSHTPSALPGRSRVARALPLATPPAPPATLAGVVYGMGRIDASGRIADRTITHILGWHPDDRLTLTASPTVVLARRDPTGMITLTTWPYLAVPAALRHRCGLHAGDRVLLAATPDDDTLTVYPLAVVDHAIRAHHKQAGAGGGLS